MGKAKVVKVEDTTIKGEKVGTKVGGEGTPINESELTVETLTVQKSKALKQRDAARQDLEDYKKENPVVEKKENKPTSTIGTFGAKDDDRLTAIEFTVNNQGLTAENVAEIVSYAKGKGISLEDAKNSQPIQDYLKAEAERKSLEAASPDGSRSPKTKQNPEPTKFEDHEAWAKEKMGLKK